ncbi:MauE/DoxX family redox-associated membrane protein [Chloroflexota bacterium]
MAIGRNKHWLGVVAGIILGLTFAVAGLGKLLHQTEAFKLLFFPDFLTPALAKAVFTLLPYVELTVGLLLITGIVAKLVTAFSALLIAGFVANNVWALIHGLGDEPCGCFGLAERMAQAQLSIMGALYLDAAMLVLVFIVLICYQRGFFDINPWFLGRR